jgi:hypothetical protein
MAILDADITAVAASRRPCYLRAMTRDAAVDPGTAHMFALNNQKTDTPAGAAQRYSEGQWTVVAIPSGKVPS